MPILTLIYHNDTEQASRNIQLSRSYIKYQQLTLTGYAIHTKHGAGTVNIPNTLVVEIEGITDGAAINVAQPPRDSIGNEHYYTYTTGLHLPVESVNTTTIKFGAHMTFNIPKTLDKEIRINLKIYDDNNRLIPANVKLEPADTECSITNVTLYFDYVV